MTDGADSIENVESFRRRARTWMAAHLRTVTSAEDRELQNQENDESVERNRALMGQLYEAGLSGICYPLEYGGQGLTVEHLAAFTEEARGYELPMMFHLPTMTILAATLLDFGTEEQKRRHLPAILSGREIWVQFLSEPSGGSDLAGARTRATLDGDTYILSGSKIWSSNAYRADYALCVCRTDWDAAKHRGLSVLIVKVHQPGVQVERIRQVNGSREFCQEFFDDVSIPLDNLVGDPNEGWTVASRLLYHEKLAVGGGSSLGLLISGYARDAGDAAGALVELARDAGRSDDAVARQHVGQGLAMGVVKRALVQRVGQAMRDGTMPGAAGSILKLFEATTSIELAELSAKIGGPTLVTGDGRGRAASTAFLMRQGAGLAGGSNEIQRNIISERVLGLPREWAGDRDIPFRDVDRLPAQRKAAGTP